MKLMPESPAYVGFLCGTILSFCVQVAVTAAEDILTTVPSVLTTQNPTSPKPSTTVITHDLLTTVALQETTLTTTQATTFEPTSPAQASPPMPFTTSQSPSPETLTSPPSDSTFPPDMPTSPYTTLGTDQETVTLGESPTKMELCEENSKRLMLICLIIIGILVFLCVCLLLVTVVLASKLSHVKRSHTIRRHPRTNGDFLSANSLWPTGLDTLQRMTTEATETSLTRQGLELESKTAGERKTEEETSRKLAKEISIRQKQKEMSPKESPAKPHSSPIL